MNRRRPALLRRTLLGIQVTMVLPPTGQCTSALRATPEQTQAQTQVPEEVPLRISDPVEEVVADLEAYIPDRMRESNLPGLTIALIRDNQLVWSAGFGLANRITGRAVTPETVFEAASISKVVTTYNALRLVEQGRLALDEPLNAYLSRPWLPPSDYADQVTLRHLASHSSGLTENVFPTIDKSIAAAPGSRFLYSGIGFMYMQEAIEQVTGKGLEGAAREAVFAPLGMASSSFIKQAETVTRMASGHMRPTLPLLLFLVPCALILAGMALVGIPLWRLVMGTWRLPRKSVAAACLAAGVMALLLIASTSLNQLPNLLLLMGLCAAAFVALFVPAFLVGEQVFARLPAGWRKGKLKPALRLAWVFLTVVLLVSFSGWFTIPVPRSPSPAPSAVGSLRTTAGDLAIFLTELAEPRYLSEEMAREMRTPQIPAGEGFSWGLGIGIQHSAQGDALWQNAQTFGFRGLMVLYPELGSGVVVLTNSDDGYPVACDAAQRALGGRALWEFF